MLPEPAQIGKLLVNPIVVTGVQLLTAKFAEDASLICPALKIPFVGGTVVLPTARLAAYKANRFVPQFGALK
ncbi:MAG: hypothetical protein EBU05_10395 [Chitinophagia bacterium]|nr:hypothetical protein [Chitinophagia bacterium]